MPEKLAEERSKPDGDNQREDDSAGANMSLVSFSRTRKQLRVQQLEDRQVRVAENTRCPSCGSSAFTQERMWS